jgi:hypothetical protein
VAELKANEEDRESAGRLRALLTPRVLLAFGASAVFFAALLMPRASASRFVPLPFVDHARLAEIDRAEGARFLLAGADEPGPDNAHGTPVTELSVGVRTVGELFRRVGAHLAADPALAGTVAAELRAQFRAEVRRGKTSELLALRSLQSQLFVRALSGTVDPAARRTELQELGGEFARLVDGGWLDGVPISGERTGADPVTLRLLFRVRWGLLVGCHREPPFGPSIEELRAYYSAYMLHPPLAQTDETAKALERVRYAVALGQADPDFPVDLATGALLLQAGLPDAAAARLRAHLQRNASGPFALLARNYLLFAVSEP